LGSDEVSGGEVVERDGDLDHALIEGFGPAVSIAPDLFEGVVGGEITALIDELNAVLELGVQGAILTYGRV